MPIYQKYSKINLISNIFLLKDGDKMEKIIIIGGGVSGIVSGISSKKSNNEVTILEKNNHPLKKLLITGNGKCNYFNKEFKIAHYYSNNCDELSKIITKENKNKILKFTTDIGIIPKIKNGYYYPASNQAYSVYNALLKEAQVKKVKIINDTIVTDIIKKQNQFIIKTNHREFIADKIVISTGSKAYPKTGSTGDGYTFAQKFSHNINAVYPALVQLTTCDKFIKELSGVRSEVEVTLTSDKIIKKETGEIQFTDYGLSGICIYNLSIPVNQLLSQKKHLKVKINFFHDFKINTIKELINELDKQNQNLKNRTITEILEGYLNYKIVNTILKISQIKPNISWTNISQDKKNTLAKNLISLSVNITGTKDFNNSQSCIGGISLKDINITTLESKKIKNMYFTGELLDVCGDCGGYNLGFAILSGLLVGEAIGDKND